ncbi:hypothetical protein BJ138DRAFT_1152453 [Hygrophoropsis aurantiaca]|uniref:Uncharacterized protein n=1 Tax=Hygrophoropsis aurantiaca TaxID=72124 RepID=A0ACB8AC41_9AGAM|nr:hypothetical protein BJ138DRAFT_1152453 [Hygrophoropsis aurantiaca]
MRRDLTLLLYSQFLPLISRWQIINALLFVESPNLFITHLTVLIIWNEDSSTVIVIDVFSAPLLWMWIFGVHPYCPACIEPKRTMNLGLNLDCFTLQAMSIFESIMIRILYRPNLVAYRLSHPQVL